MNSFLENTKIVVINLKERTDKKKYIQDTFQKKNIKYEFFEAQKHKNPKRGCLESHLNVIQKALAQNYKKLLIFEDDVKFIGSFNQLKVPPNDWDMLYLGGTVHRVVNRDHSKYPRVMTWTTHAYFINLERPELISEIQKVKDYDGEIDRYYLEKIHPHYKAYMCDPMIAIQKEGYSDIENQEVSYDFMQSTLQGLRVPDHEVSSEGHYVLKLDPIDSKDLPKVSIITPTYKRRKLFDMALYNFENFDYPKKKIEWVIVDDSPKKVDKNGWVDDDGVEDMVRHIRNVKYVRLEAGNEPLTVAMKRNIGVSNASADYIVHMDDDDYYPPESIRARIQLLLKYQKEDIHCVGSTLIGTYNILNNTSSMSSDGPISLSEASMAYTKKFWETRGFDDDCVRGEHKYFSEQRLHQIMDIPYSFIIIAMNHRSNMSNELRGDDNLLKFSENNEKHGNVANFYDTWDIETQMFIIELRKHILK